MNERFLSIIRMKGMTASQFADLLGIQRSAISHFTSGRNKPSLEMVTKVITAFPDINTEWLLFGHGEPLKNPEVPGSKHHQPVVDKADAGLQLPFPEEEQPSFEKQETAQKPDASGHQNAAREETTLKNIKKKKEEKNITQQPEEPEQIIFFYEEGRYKIYRPL